MPRYAFILLAALACCYAPVRAQTLPPAENFVADPLYHNLSLSPDGRFLAAARRIQSEDSVEKLRKLRKKKSFTARQARDYFKAELPNDEVIIIDLWGEREPKLAGVDKNAVDSIQWANNQKVLVTLATPISFDYWTAVGTVTLALDIDSGKGVFLLENKRSVRGSSRYLSDIVHMLPDDPDHILMAAHRQGDLDLWKVNINDGKAKLVERGVSNTFRWVVTRNGDPAFRLDGNARGTAMFANAKVGNSWKRIAEVRMERASNNLPEFWPIGPGQRPNEIYVRSRSESEDRMAIRTFDLQSGEFGETILARPDVDVDDGLLDYVTGEYVAGFYYDDRMRVEFKDPSVQRHVAAIDQFFGEEANIFFENFSSESGIFLLRVSGPVTPGEYYFYDSKKASMTPVFSAFPKLGRKDLSPTEYIKYPARDGQVIRGFLTHPDGDATSMAPLIVMPHGGPEARTVYGYDPLVQFLANRGYRVLQPNFRGSSGFGRKFAESGYGEWGGKMQDDVDDGAGWLIEQGLAERGRICILGASYGGYAALYGAMSSPDLYACAVATAAVSDLIEILKHSRREEGGDSATYKYFVQSIGDPDDDFDKLVANSPARHADKINIPLLVVHGRADDVVPIDQAELMMAALDEAGRPYEKLIFEDERHSFVGVLSKIEYFEAVEEFLGKHLPAAVH